MHRRTALWAIGSAAWFCGCDPAATDFTEVRRTEEPIAPTEWARFVRIVKSLPGEKFPVLPDFFPPPPQWAANRTLPINELAAEEQQILSRAADPTAWGRVLQRDRTVMRALRRELWTPDQLAGMIQSVGIAYCRLRVANLKQLDEWERIGGEQTAAIVKDDRGFASLPPEEQFTVLSRAAWLTRLERARQLQRSSPLNRTYVETNAEWLARVLPPDFLIDPLAEIPDLELERGQPFRELPSTGEDHFAQWDRGQAIVGPASPRGK